MLNRLLVAAMPLAPRFIVRSISKRYIAGEDRESALQLCGQLADAGFLTTLDILGESVTTEAQALTSRDAYLELIDAVVDAGIERNMSLKPTALGLAFSPELAFESIRSIVSKAAEKDLFIRIDMENSPYTQHTLDFYKTLRQDFSNVGTVIQAYLKRSANDVREISQHGGNLRICKGIYREAPEIAYQDREEVRQNFRLLVDQMFEEDAYVGIATHDLHLIQMIQGIIEESSIPRDRYEFQALLGVPIEDTLRQLMAEGHRVRIYVPFGSQWYAYSSRRLKENPDIAGYVMRDWFKRGRR